MTATRLAVLLVTQAHLVLTVASAAQLTALVHDDRGKPLPDAVVVAFPEDGRAVSPRTGEEVVDQIDKEFVPYVKAVRVGSTVQFPKKDDIRHHVYSFSPTRPFELPLYSGTPARPVLFDKVGIVKLGCNIHDWMLGYIYVTDAPYFAQSGSDGRAVLDQLPGKRYRLRVWHPRMEIPEDKTVKQVDLSDETKAAVQWKLKLKPEFRPRRMPLPGEPGYR